MDRESRRNLAILTIFVAAVLVLGYVYVTRSGPPPPHPGPGQTIQDPFGGHMPQMTGRVRPRRMMPASGG